MSVYPENIETGEWSEEEREELDRICDGKPSAPSADLVYWLTDCFVCGAVRVSRWSGQPPPGAPVGWRPDESSRCTGCGAPVQHVAAKRLPVLSDPSAKQLGPFVRESETSRRAALEAYPRQGTQRWRILHAFMRPAQYSSTPRRGWTRDELADFLHTSPNTIRPRVVELIQGGWLEEHAELTRKTASGRDAAVLVLTPLAQTKIGPQVGTVIGARVR